MSEYALAALINEVFLPWIGIIAGSVIGLILTAFLLSAILDYMSGD